MTKTRILLLVSVVVVPFLVFSGRMQPNTSVFATAVQEVIYPFEYIWHVSTNFVSHTWRRYRDLHQAAVENATLRNQIAALQTKLLLYEDMNAETQRLREFLHLPQRYRAKMVAAEVIAPPVFPFLSVRVNRGSRHGVQVGMPVVNLTGVVGRVVRTGIFHADVQLLIDTGFYADVLIQRTRVRSLLQGDFDNCVLSIHHTAEMKIGDTIITSGIPGDFPKGIPVGRVVRISYKTDNVAQQITVEPWIDYMQMEEVSIILQRSPQIEHFASKQWLSPNSR